MIRRDDFEIDIGHNTAGTSVRITHSPTGNVREAQAVKHVGRTRDALVAELKGLVFKPDHFRIALQCGREASWYLVTHLPSGLNRRAENTGDHELPEELIATILDELHTTGQLETSSS